jgi:WXG100 family type VII secretion target
VPGFDVEPWQLAAAAGLTREVSEQARAALSRVDIEVDTLLARWRGPAAAHFAAGWQRWRSGALQTLAGLDAAGELLEATGRSYASAESASVSAAA